MQTYDPWSFDSFPYLIAFIAGLIIFFGLKQFRKLLFKGELEGKEEKAIRDISFRKLGRKIEREETEARTDTS